MATVVSPNTSNNASLPPTLTTRDTLSPIPSEITSNPVATVTPIPAPAPTHVNISNKVYPALPHPGAPGAAPKLDTSKLPGVPATVPLTIPTTTTQQTGKSKSKSKKSKKATVTMATAEKASSDKTGSNGENTGRWTAEEHRLFLQGLEEHGKGWKKIASLIKSRTVVQIRTHAQKYFQKLAKARQNGEEGDVAMDGRGGVASITTNGTGMSPSGQHTKRRRASGGTKRKAIASVVQSAQRDGKIEMNMGQKVAVSPTLAPYVVQPTPVNGSYNMQGNILGGPSPDVMATALEDSLYRFLTPATGDSVQPIHQTGDGVDPMMIEPSQAPNTHMQPNNYGPSIILPNDPTVLGGEGSPTSVVDVSFPCFGINPNTKEPEPPHWFAKGSDVDDLLTDADALDWLTDTGDVNLIYKPEATPIPSLTPEEPSLCSTSESEPDEVLVNSYDAVNSYDTVNSYEAAQKTELDTNPSAPAGLETLPPVVSSSSIAIETLPSLFESADNLPNKRLKVSHHAAYPTTNETTDSNLAATTQSMDDEGFSVFDSNFDEQAFVTALLESNENAALSVIS